MAEKLEVSRQSVSKWETGQSVPELDKIVKLADLFGVSVDELVRDGKEPRPTPAQGETAAPQVVYVERRLAPTQIVGVVFLVLGLLGFILGVAASGNTGTYTAMAGGGMVVPALPFLLSRKHPFLITVYLFAALLSIVRGALFLILLFFTGRAVMRRPTANEPSP